MIARLSRSLPMRTKFSRLAPTLVLASVISGGAGQAQQGQGDVGRDPLLLGALAGHDGAWTALIRQHERRVVASLLALGVPLERALEISQETWTRLIERQRAGALDRLELPGLAIAQARFIALDERRSARVRRAMDGDAQELLAGLPDDGATPEERAATREEIARADRVLATCSPTAQKLFRLLHQEPPLSQAQAAKEVGLSLQRTRQIVCMVRKKLRAELAS
jgi:RNA polymerase sigma factor (sigma-70 family)